MLWNPYEYQTRSFKILRDTRQNAMKFISMGNKLLHDPTRFYGILDKNAMDSISIQN